MKILDRLPLLPLLFLALFLGLAPLAPEPHLIEKLRMLLAGSLARPIDIFDLVMHGAPLLLLAARVLRLLVAGPADRAG